MRDRRSSDPADEADASASEVTLGPQFHVEDPAVHEGVTTTRSAARSFLLSFVTSGGTMVLVFMTGVLTARLLTADGRGQVAAVSAWILTFTWASSLGFPKGIAFHVARGEDDRRAALSVLLLGLVPLGMIGVGIAQLLLPIGFAAQSDETRALARLFFCGIPAVVAMEGLNAFLAGLERFVAMNRARLAQPLLYLLALLTLWATGWVRPWTVLAAQLGSYVVVTVGVIAYLVHVVRPARRLDRGLARRSLVYGLRQQGVALGELVTGRLDLIMLPAYVTAAAVGFYSIAVNISSMIMLLFGSLSLVVFPMATRDYLGGDLRVVHQGVRVSLYGGLAAVLVLAAGSPLLIGFVYGEVYLAALPSLWILLPGVIVWSCSAILAAGLQAVGSPGRASIAQFVGVAVTVIGLVLMLPRFGIEGAAAVSTVAYTGTFVVLLAMLVREPAFSMAQALSPTQLRTDLTAVVRRLQRRRSVDEAG